MGLLTWTWVTEGIRQRYQDGGQWTSRTWLDDLTDWHAGAPDDVAVIDGSTRVRVGEVVDGARRVAGHLQARGVGAGEVVSLAIPNWWEFATIHAAVTMLGAVVNPMLPTLGAADIAHVLRTGGSKAVFAAGPHRGVDALERVREAAPDGVIVVGVRSDGDDDLRSILDSDRASFTGAEVDAAGPDSLLFTSGTESLPKGAVHLHQTSYYGCGHISVRCSRCPGGVRSSCRPRSATPPGCSGASGPRCT